MFVRQNKATMCVWCSTQILLTHLLPKESLPSEASHTSACFYNFIDRRCHGKFLKVQSVNNKIIDPPNSVPQCSSRFQRCPYRYLNFAFNWWLLVGSRVHWQKSCPAKVSLHWGHCYSCLPEGQSSDTLRFSLPPVI